MRGVPVPGTHEPGFVEEPLVERSLPLGVKRLNPDSRGMRHFKMGEVTVLICREPAAVGGELLWHLSLSHPNRHPSWDEIKTVRYRLLPDHLCFGMLLPPSEFYVNVPAHDHVFHLWEILDPREPWSAG